MAFIVITILVQAAIAFAVLHAFKVRKQKNITSGRLRRGSGIL